MTRYRMMMTAWLALIPSVTMAQEAAPETVPAIAVPETAPAADGTLPTAAPALSAEVAPETSPATPPPEVAAAATPGYFPSLPPSRPCVREDARGLWRLTQLFENPITEIMSDFTAYPSQYLFFREDGSYGAYKSAQTGESEKAIRDYLKTPGEGDLLQYVFHPSGVIYFYVNSVPVSSMACFIVANARTPFAAGQVLLMPPASEANGKRLVKVYSRSEAALAAQNTKGKKKRGARKAKKPAQAKGKAATKKARGKRTKVKI